ncbi:hypothetical protein [Streptomyces hydrogenans]|uniref:hypothetical protein n=1 Tax=Streptomyces hydrogenans TaxID=1873719 RepID=UPI003816FA40
MAKERDAGAAGVGMVAGLFHFVHRELRLWHLLMEEASPAKVNWATSLMATLHSGLGDTEFARSWKPSTAP